MIINVFNLFRVRLAAVHELPNNENNMNYSKLNSYALIKNLCHFFLCVSSCLAAASPTTMFGYFLTDNIYCLVDNSSMTVDDLPNNSFYCHIAFLRHLYPPLLVSYAKSTVPWCRGKILHWSDYNSSLMLVIQRVSYKQHNIFQCLATWFLNALFIF